MFSAFGALNEESNLDESGRDSHLDSSGGSQEVIIDSKVDFIKLSNAFN